MFAGLYCSVNRPCMWAVGPQWSASWHLITGCHLCVCWSPTSGNTVDLSQYMTLAVERDINPNFDFLCGQQTIKNKPPLETIPPFPPTPLLWHVHFSLACERFLKKTLVTSKKAIHSLLNVYLAQGLEFTKRIWEAKHHLKFIQKLD